MHGHELSDDAKKIVHGYAMGKFTASGAAWELWNRKLTPLDDPRAGDVIVWAKECGYGIPIPPDDEVEEQVRKALDMIQRRQKSSSQS